MRIDGPVRHVAWPLLALVCACSGRPVAGCFSVPAVTAVRVTPRAGSESLISGGHIQGSNLSPTNGFTDLALIQTAPAPGNSVDIAIASPAPFRWVKYYGPPGSHGVVAEVVFMDGTARLSGQPFGTVATTGHDSPAAFDGNPSTYYQGALPDDQYVGLDFGAGHEATKVVASPEGGRFSTSQTVTLTTATPATVKFTIDGSDPRAGGAIYKGPISISSSTVLKAVAQQDCTVEGPLLQAVFYVGPPSKSVQASESIGNSLSATIQDFYPVLAANGGIQLSFNYCFSAGASTPDLWAATGCDAGDTNLKQTLRTKSFDHLTLQPFAFKPCTPGASGGDAQYVNDFYQLAKGVNPDVQLWIFQQWPQPSTSDWSQVDCLSSGSVGVTPPWVPPSASTDWESAELNQLAYHEAVRAAMVPLVGAGKKPLVLPAGLALRNLKHAIEGGTIPGLSNFYTATFGNNGTDLHLAPAGRYFVSLVWYGALFQRDPSGLASACWSLPNL